MKSGEEKVIQNDEQVDEMSYLSSLEIQMNTNTKC